MGDAASTRTSILHLPQDLQAQCLKHLSATERVTSARVCRAWRCLVFESSLLWDRMELWLAAGMAGGTGRFSSLLKQLRPMGQMTAQLELLLGPPCYVTDDGRRWRSFNLQQLLAAFPRLRTLRLFQIRSARTEDSFGAPAAGLPPGELAALCQSCTGLVELGMNPVCGDGCQLKAALAPLQQLPHLRRLHMVIVFDAPPLRTSLQCLLSLTGLEELRCVVHNAWSLHQIGWPGEQVTAVLPGVSKLVRLQALDLPGERWFPARVHGRDTSSLPPGLTSLSVRVSSWQALLPEVSTLRLQGLSVDLDEDVEYDLGSVACLTQLTRLHIGMVTWGSMTKAYGGGLVLPQVERLVLSWNCYGKLPPFVDWASLGRLTYLCLQPSNREFNKHARDLDFRQFARLKALVLKGCSLCYYAMRLPTSLTGLQMERYEHCELPQHLADATGLRFLALPMCQLLDTRRPAFKDRLRAMVSLTTLHCCVHSYGSYGLGEPLPGTYQACEEWACAKERMIRRLMPWLKQGACRVLLQHEWNRDVSGRPPACLKRQADPDDLLSQLRTSRHPEYGW